MQQEEQSSKRYGWVKWIVAIAVLALIISKCSGGKDEDKKPGGPVPVKIAAVKRQDVPFYLTGIGTITSPNSADIRTQIDGQLMEIDFKEGQDVKKGDLIARIDSRAIRAALAEAKAEKAKAVAQLETAKLDAERYQNLLKSDAIARQTVDQQVAQVKQLQAAVDAADASIESSLVQLSYTRITAPFDGRIGIRSVDVGNIVRTSDAEGIVKVTQVKPITAIFSLPQDTLASLEKDSGKDVPVDAISKDGDQMLANGTLSSVDSEVDDSTGTIKLRALFDNKDEKLWPGQLVALRLLNGIHTDSKVIPVTAIQRGRDGNTVFKLKGEDETEQTKVTIAYEDSDIAVISNGLTFEDKVVVDGQSRLKPNSKIKIIADLSAPATPKQDAAKTTDTKPVAAKLSEVKTSEEPSAKKQEPKPKK